MAKKMPKAIYQAVFDRAESDARYPACEAAIFGVCSFLATEWHHRKMRSQGGGHEVVNGLAVCADCHRFFHENPVLAYHKGWLVKSHSDPASAHVQRRGRLVILCEDGSFEEVTA